jgi:hypothetical protein
MEVYMPVSSIDYEKVDTRLLGLIQMIAGLENQITSVQLSNTEATKDIIFALDKYREEIALEIEKQGAR